MHHVHVSDEEFERLVQTIPDAVVAADDDHKFLVHDGVCHMAPLHREQGSASLTVATGVAAAGGAAWHSFTVGLVLAIVTVMYLGIVALAVYAERESRKRDAE